MAVVPRRTKIVATIGPASRDPEVLVRMVEAGMDVARLNFSHGTAAGRAAAARAVRQAATEAATALVPEALQRTRAQEDGNDRQTECRWLTQNGPASAGMKYSSSSNLSWRSRAMISWLNPISSLIQRANGSDGGSMSGGFNVRIFTSSRRGYQ